MKKLTALTAVVAMIAAFSLAAPNEVKANEGFHAVELTHCNSQDDPDQHVGFSNDCAKGPGGCIDNACNPGSYEVHNESLDPGGSN